MSPGFDVRVVGGAVRDVLQDKRPTDIDMATSATPTEIVDICTNEGIKHILTGVQHGTVTLMVDDKPHEVTTLRVDTDTDGRHAEVEFTTDFQLDAARRDLTINAMSVDVDGTLYDYFDGMLHLEKKQVLFVGDPVERIAEDYLRILRYFRFYGRIAVKGALWDESTISAIDKNKAGLQQISRERIWLEMQKIIVGKQVKEILQKMNSLNLFPLINLTDKFNIEDLTSQHSMASVSEIRSATMLSYAFKAVEDFTKLRKAWKMSMDEEYIGQFVIKHRNETELKYFQDLLVDTPKHCRHKFHMGFKELCLSRGSSDENLMKTLTDWNVPEYPLRGDQVIKHLSLPRGPLVYKYVTLGKNKWKESHFSLSGEEVLTFLADEYNKSKR